MKRCQTCGQKIADAAAVCPHCRQRQSFMGMGGQPASSGVGIGVGGSLGGGLGGMGGGTGRSGARPMALLAGVLIAVGAGAASFMLVRQAGTTAPVAQPQSSSSSSPSASAAADVAQALAALEAPPQPTALPSPPAIAPASSPSGPAQAAPSGACRTPETRSARFAAVVQKRLGRPADFEVVRTTMAPARDGNATIILAYRASTGSGAPREGVAIGKVGVSDCAVAISVVT